MSPALHSGRVKTSRWSWLRWPGVLLLNLVILFLVGVSTLRESIRTWTTDREILTLESQAELLEGRKFKLAQLAQDLVSPERTELDARSRLGWKKEGEQVFVLSGYEVVEPKTSETLNAVSVAATPLSASNPRLWWNYFFKSGI